MPEDEGQEMEILEQRVEVPEYFMLPSQSDDIKELLAALVKATSEFKPVEKSGLNTVPHRYRYSTLDDMNKATKDALTKNDLVITHQELPITREYWILATKLQHSKSGQWLASYAPIDPKPEAGKGFSSMQEWGKQCSYIKKYQLGAVLNLSPEDDSDAAPASQGAGKSQQETGSKPPKQKAEKGSKKPGAKSIGDLKTAITKAEKALKGKNLDVETLRTEYLKADSLSEVNDKETLEKYLNALQERLKEAEAA